MPDIPFQKVDLIWDDQFLKQENFKVIFAIFNSGLHSSDDFFNVLFSFFGVTKDDIMH